MPKHTPLTEYLGKKFGRLFIIEMFPGIKSEGKLRECRVRCDCGNVKIIALGNLISGRTKSCGCLNIEVVKKRFTTHGQRYNRIYTIYGAMMQRVNGTGGEVTRKTYSDKGITVCDEWRNSFLAFYEWAMANGYNKKLSLDRRENKGNYGPDNCRWADRKTQSRNRNHVKTYEYNGVRYYLPDLSIITGIKYGTLYKRIVLQNWDVGLAVSTPLMPGVVQNMSLSC